ncbi:MAG TPA: dTDP-4-dehydrorhamnose reductase [Steroidobacteraceae bacterium]|nr:dTDP-4-dehydrorhamnose reductase [Gammaproteobacteria bacterium]HEV2287199.1 dTDP-4-dehydrorhamnose reductase [Steroidobacteraceae bacterium]
MRVLITGAGGQLGRALCAAAPPGAQVRALGRAELDVADADAVRSVFAAFAPELVINAAAYTRVDEAEGAPEDAARANTLGPAVLAAACRDAAWLVHVSTDFVFDGRQGSPYGAQAQPNPLSVYGRTKLAGESAVLRELPGGAAVVRASWLYSAAGGFAARMLALMRTRPELRVVSDQVGAPTHAAGLAGTLWALGMRRAPGLWHWCDSGVASWYDFAVAVAEEAQRLRILAAVPPLVPIGSADYPARAARPSYSVLDKRATEAALGTTAPHWRTALRATLAPLAGGGAQP